MEFRCSIIYSKEYIFFAYIKESSFEEIMIDYPTLMNYFLMNQFIYMTKKQMNIIIQIFVI